MVLSPILPSDYNVSKKNLRRSGGKVRMTHDEAFSEIITMAQKYAPYYIAEETMLNQQETDAEIILSEKFPINQISNNELQRDY